MKSFRTWIPSWSIAKIERRVLHPRGCAPSNSARLRPSEGLMIPDGETLLPLTDWSFSQLCSIAGVDRRTVNKVREETAARIFSETLPQRGPAVQTYRVGDALESIHGSAYTGYSMRTSSRRSSIRPTVSTGATVERSEDRVILRPARPLLVSHGRNGRLDGDRGEQFAPGFFVWNSEVGKTTVGIQSFWFQKSCSNH